MPDISWSPWLLLDSQTIKDKVPEKPGVFKTRKKGTSAIAYIGSATGEKGLKGTLQQRITNPEKYLSAFEKDIAGIGGRLQFCYAEAQNEKQANEWEAQALYEYQQVHGALPLGNQQQKRPISR